MAIARTGFLLSSILLALVSSTTADEQVGREYYVGIPLAPSGSSPVFEVMIGTPSDEASYAIESSTAEISQGTVSSGESATIELDNTFEVTSSEFSQRAKGLRIYSTDDNPISVLIGIRFSRFFFFGYSAYTVYPNSVFQGVDIYEYFAVSTDYDGNPNGGFLSNILLVGNDDETMISITPTQTVSLPSDAQSESALVEVTAGSTHTVTLQRLQTLSLTNDFDLSGTRIVSNKPITVISGHQCAQVPATEAFCEPLYVHVPPTVNWGQLFLLAPLGGRTSPQLYKLVTSEDSTDIAFRCGTDGSQGLPLPTSGSCHTITLAADSYCYLTASEPVFLVQLAFGFGIDNTGDPAVATVSPVVGHVKSTSFLASPSGNFPDNFITVTVLAEHFTETQIQLDGTQLGCTWTDIFDFDDEVVGHGCTASIQPGTHVVSHEGEDGVLSVIVCGWGAAQAGYAYLTGQILQVTEQPTQVPEIEFDELLTYFDLSGVPDVKELLREPDSHSDPIFIPGSIVYGDEIVSRLFVNENGAFSFNDPWMYAHPNRYPTNYLPSRQRHVLSPFWSDVDIRREGTVRFVSISRGSSVRGDMILEETATYFNDRFGNEDDDQPFEPTWMIVAQWEGVHPYPHGSDDLEGLDQEYLSRTNTFQGVVVTNNAQSFYGFSYACGDIQWSGQGDETAIVGFNSLADYFFNHPANGVPDIGRIVSCIRQVLPAGGRKKRQAEENNDPANGPLPCNPEVKEAITACMGLANLDDISFPDDDDDDVPIEDTIEDEQGRVVFDVLPACPPTLALVTLSPLFQPFPDQTRNCYQSNARFIPRPGGRVKPYEFVSVCCYDGNGAVIREGAEAGRILDVTGSSYDEQFRSNCCNFGLCEEYQNKRPLVPIAPPGQTRCASANGDPHYRTFDGIVHHFLNGDNRHYFLMRVTNDQEEDLFYLQGFLQFTPWRATTTKSLAFGVPGSYAYQFVSNNQPVLHRTFPGPPVQMTGVDNSDVRITLENRGSQVVCRVDFLQLSMRLVATYFSSDFINYEMCVAEEVCRASVGHLGSCIENQGSSIPTVNEQLITQEQSFFMEPIIAGRRKRQEPEEAPPLEDLEFTDEQRRECNNDESCLYDLVVTGDNAVALATRDASEEIQRMQSLIANNPPNITSDSTIFRVNVREENVFTFFVMDTDAVTVSIEGGAPEGSSLSSDEDGMYTFKWTPTEVPTRELTFVAVDTLEAASTFTPLVEVCACFNGGECTLQGVLISDSLIQTLTCLCTEAYSGDTCSEDRNGCAEVECFRGVECLDVPAPGVGAMCGACSTGFTGDGLKCTDLDECSQDDTLCDQICNNTIGSFVCSCELGFALMNDICEDVNECAGANDCQQTCVNNEGSFECTCEQGFTLDNDGRSCNPLTECGAHSCSHICAVIDGVEECSCPSGLQLAQGSATDCEDVDECDQFSPCDQVCTNTDGSFMCSCNPGYQLDDATQICEDIDECRMAILDGTEICTLENSECINTDGSFDCVCVGGYELSDGECTRIPDEVIEPPEVILPELGEDNAVTFVVQIGGIEELTVSRIQEFREVTAAAVTRFCLGQACALITSEGETSEISVTVRPENVAVLTGDVTTDNDGNPLLMFYVQLAADRVVAASVLTAVLEEAEDLYGEAGFLDVDECETDNGGCADVCVNTEGSFECSCGTGFTLGDDGLSCDDIDECVSGNDCDSNAVCSNTPGSFTCTCKDGYTGDGVTCILEGLIFRFIGNTPIVVGRRITLNLEFGSDVEQATCQIVRNDGSVVQTRDCTSGTVSLRVPNGVQSRERLTPRITLIRSDGSSESFEDENRAFRIARNQRACSPHLINTGISTSENGEVTVEWGLSYHGRVNLQDIRFTCSEGPRAQSTLCVSPYTLPAGSDSLVVRVRRRGGCSNRFSLRLPNLRRP